MKNEFLRHTISAIKFRFEIASQNGSDEFGAYALGNESRGSSAIINHMYRVADATEFYVQNGEFRSEKVDDLPYQQEIDRFYEKLESLDRTFENTDIDADIAKRLLHGPLADMLTHVGQIAMLKRSFGTPIKGMNYFKQTIKTGLN